MPVWRTLAKIDTTLDGNVGDSCAPTLIRVGELYDSFYVLDVHRGGWDGHFVVWRVLECNDRGRPNGGTLSSHGVHAERISEAQRIVQRAKKIERSDASVIGTGINLVQGQ